MTQSIDNRPGVDTKIVQTSVLRGCDALFPGDRDGVLLTIRGADVQDGGTPGDVYVMPGLNVSSDAVSTVYHISRSREEQDPILMLVGGVDPSATARFAIHGGVTPPDGLIFARESSLFFDHSTPGLWIKTTDESLNTGWEQLATVNVTAEDLEETLQIGNVTGALPIIVNNTNSGMHGEDGVGVSGISYTIRAGNSGGANGGALDVLAGAVSAGGGNGGNLRLAAGASTGGAAGGFGGNVSISAGLSGNANDGGSVTITAGVGGPNAGGGGGDIGMTAGAGIGGVGGSITGVGGAGGTGQAGGAIIFTAGVGSPGGAVEIKSGGGSGALAAGGPVTIAAGDPDGGGGPGASVLIAASDAIGAFTGGNITLNPGTGASGDGAVIVNGKLTVTGIIDPIGVIFQETSGEADVTVPSTEGAIYVSDGSNGRTQNALYYKDDSGNHFQLAPPAAGASFVEAFGRVTWGYLSVSADSGLEVDSVGRLNGHTLTSSGSLATTSRSASSSGASLTLGSGNAADTSYSSLETNSTFLRRDSRPLFVFKFQLGGNSTEQRVFIGVTNQGPAFHANANFPSGAGEYAGLTVAAGTGNFNFTSFSNSGGGLYTGPGLAIDLNVHYLVMDMTVSDRITWTLLDEDFNVELTSTNSTATSLPLSGSLLDVMVVTGTSDAVVNNLRFYHCNMIERADALAQAFGGGAAPLQTVLSLGNTTGGNDIEVTNGDFIRGIDDGGAGSNGGSLLLVSGNTSSAAGDSGNVFIFTNAVTNVAASGDTGTIQITSGPISLAGQTGDTGNINIGTGGTVGPGASGDVVIATGVTTSTEAGAIQLLAGSSSGDEGGFIQLLAGDSAGVGLQGGLINITAGNSGDAQGGNVEVFGGNAGAGNNDGGSIVLTPGTGSGTGSDGVVFVAGKLTVTGIIDPTGLVLDNQATVPEGTPAPGKSTLWVRSSDNALIVTDDAGVDTPVGTGGGSTTLAGLTDVTLTAPAIGQVLTFNGVDWENAPSTAGGGTLNLAQALGEIQFGAYLPGGAGIEGSENYSGGTVTTTSGGGVVLDSPGQTEGPYSIFFTDSGLPLNHGGYYATSRRTNYQGRCFSTVKFRLGTMASAADPQFFAGWSQGNVGPTSLEGQLDSANVPTFHVGVEVDELNNPGETTFYFTFDESATGKTRVNTGVAFSPSQELFLTIDATVANAVTVTLYDASYSSLATHTFTTTPTLIDYSPMVCASTSNPGNTRFDHFYFRNVWRADLVAALSGVGAADLATVLATGNTSGGNDIILTAGDNIQGEDSAAPGTLNITSGSATVTGVNGSNLALAAGSTFGAAGDNGGTVTLVAQSGSNNAAADGGNGGAVLMNTGFGGNTTLAGSNGGLGGTYSLLMGSGGDATTGTAGNGGQFVINTGDGGDAASGTAGEGGRILLITGNGGTDSSGNGGNGGTIEISPGNGGTGNGAGNSGGNGQGVTITGGNGGFGATGADGGDGGNVTIVAGLGSAGATAGVPGIISLTAGSSSVLAPVGGSVVLRSNQNSGVSRGSFLLLSPAGAIGGDALLNGGDAFSGSGTDGGSVTVLGGAGDPTGTGDGGDTIIASGPGGGTGGEAGSIHINVGNQTLPPTPARSVFIIGGTEVGSTANTGAVIIAYGHGEGAPGRAGVLTMGGGTAESGSGDGGGHAFFSGGNGDGVGAGGNVTITGGGGGLSGTPGVVYLAGAGAGPVSAGGSVVLKASPNATPGGSEGATITAGRGIPATSAGAATITGGSAAVASGEDGGAVLIQSGNGDGAGVNGTVHILGGTFAPPLITEGSVLMRGADNASSGSEGAFVLAVASVGSTSGSVVARGGDAAGASGDSGGDITLQAGAGDGAGVNGDIILTPGTGGASGGVIDFDGLIDRNADGYKHGTTGPTAAASNPIAFTTAFPAGPPITINVMIQTTGAGAVPPVYFIHTVSGAGFTLEFAAAPPAGTVIHWTARQ